MSHKPYSQSWKHHKHSRWNLTSRGNCSTLRQQQRPLWRTRRPCTINKACWRHGCLCVFDFHQILMPLGYSGKVIGREVSCFERWWIINNIVCDLEARSWGGLKDGHDQGQKLQWLRLPLQWHTLATGQWSLSLWFGVPECCLGFCADVCLWGRQEMY